MSYYGQPPKKARGVVKRPRQGSEPSTYLKTSPSGGGKRKKKQRHQTFTTPMYIITDKKWNQA